MNDVVNRFEYAFDVAHGRVPGPIAPLQDEPQDESSIRPIKTTKTVLVPQIQSMKDYILRHHKRMILGTLNRNIREGMLRLPMAHAETNTVLTSASCSFRDMNFWRVDKYTALADVIVDVDVFGDDEISTMSLYAEMWIGMEKGMEFRMGECGYLEQLPERPYWRLSNYLIPILRKEEIEADGEELLLRLIPDALTDKQMHNPFVLAERMGLQVMRLPLYDNTRTLSMLRVADAGVWSNYRVFHAGMPSGVPVANGGTGATTAANARSNLGANNASNINAGTLAMARLPFKVAYGSGNVAGNSALTINYSSAGFTSVPHVVVSYSTTGSNWSGDNGALKIYNKTATGATIIVGGSFNTSRAIDWIAIGT